MLLPSRRAAGAAVPVARRRAAAGRPAAALAAARGAHPGARRNQIEAHLQGEKMCFRADTE